MKLAVVGCGCSTATEPVAEISYQWNISQVCMYTLPHYFVIMSYMGSSVGRSVGSLYVWSCPLVWVRTEKCYISGDFESYTQALLVIYSWFSIAALVKKSIRHCIHTAKKYNFVDKFELWGSTPMDKQLHELKPGSSHLVGEGVRCLIRPLAANLLTFPAFRISRTTPISCVDIIWLKINEKQMSCK